MATNVERFAEALRRERIGAGLSQRQLARLIGWDNSTISKYERGNRKSVPSQQEIELFEKAMGIRDQRLSAAAGWAARTGGSRKSVSYGGAELSSQEELEVLNYIDYIRSKRRR